MDKGRHQERRSGAISGAALRRDPEVASLIVDALLRSEERYRSVVENLPELVARLLPGGNITLVNEAFCRFFGRTRQEMLGTSYFSVIHQEDLARVHSMIDSLTPEDPVANDEHRVLRPDCPVAWLEWVVRGIFDEAGDLAELQTVSRDVTAQRAAERSLRQSEKRYRVITEAISDGIWTTRLDHQISFVSPTIEKLVGRPAEELVGLSLSRIMAPQSFALARDTLLEELRLDGQEDADPRRTRTLDLQLHEKDGEPVWCEVKMSFLRDGNGTPTGVLGVARDISSWKDAQDLLFEGEERLRRTQRLEAVGQLAGGIAHDFNNLLTVILGNLEFISREIETGHSLHQPVEEMNKAVKRVASLTRQLLAFSCRQVMIPEILSLNTVIEKKLGTLSGLAGDDIELQTNLAADLDLIEADPSQLEVVLINLTVNARHAMPDGGRLVIETANSYLSADRGGGDFLVHEGRYAMLTVSDSGHGIPEEDQAKIFEPFFTTRQIGDGSGLGLSTVYGIVKQSGGYIWVDSRPEQGARFEIHLPVAAPADHHG
jgi:PAS domain S-box-containing protein